MCNQTETTSLPWQGGEAKEVAMKTLLILLAVGLALAACDSDIQPTKAPVLDQTPQTDTAPKPATGGEQPPPAQ